MTSPRCEECGASLEGVASYQLQHPRGMELAVATYDHLLRVVADSVHGRASLDEIRRRVRREANGATRVRRRDGEPVPGRGVGEWPVTVADVLAVEPVADAYAEAVARWARSIVELLEPGSPPPTWHRHDRDVPSRRA